VQITEIDAAHDRISIKRVDNGFLVDKEQEGFPIKSEIVIEDFSGDPLLSLEKLLDMINVQFEFFLPMSDETLKITRTKLGPESVNDSEPWKDQT